MFSVGLLGAVKILMNIPKLRSKEIVCELMRSADNPRNSEGDFALLRNGDILFAYSRYHGSDSDDDSPCDIAGLISHDCGRSFEPLPDLLVRALDHGVQNLMSVSFSRLPDGQLALFYLCKHSPQSAYYMRRADVDDETVFGEAETVIPQKNGIYYVVNNSRVCVTKEGTLLIPAAMHRVIRAESGKRDAEYYAASVVFRSENGRTWRRLPHVFRLPQRGYSETGLQEPGVVELPDGRLYAYFRTDRAFQYESVSADGGQTWTVPVQSRFTSPESPMLIRRNPYSGHYFAFWNPIPLFNGRIRPDAPWIDAGRTPLVMAVSESGTDYSSFVTLEDDATHGYCYPAACFLDAKTLLLSYCCGGPEDGNCLTRTRIVRISLN